MALFLSRHSAIFQKRNLCHCGSKSFMSTRSLELPFCCCLITKSSLTLLGDHQTPLSMSGLIK